ncbi:sugar phosphate nucleotidyltransferase [Peristeroidobacter agariperforans]|uniref:sugar phosphate nucleotidyltransferase n=1 Tax=Peristeroidobacter agariperforans TaxID=268404 RepID=UPI00101B655E|nr:sugar phosphate nucleotidyltransferase [Peristeroidobacter agariperforans]
MTDTLRSQPHRWALVLAAGEGSRLRALTTQPCGTPVPKQYCSLSGGPSLVEDALARARTQVAAERVCAIVAQQHHRWWSNIPALCTLTQPNLIVQPSNRGTAIGILYSLVHILSQDPEAQVLMLPSDHYVAHESILQRSLAAAMEHVSRCPDQPVLLGLHPEEPDSELGYIVPGESSPFGAQTVARFVEKPELPVAAQIVRKGGLWNTFIIAASARALLDLYLPRFAPTVMEMQVIVSSALQHKSAGGWPAIVDMYTRMPDLDFSRDLLEGREGSLCVLPVPACGWSDLGTPHRVGETLRKLAGERAARRAAADSGYINLAARHANFERSMAGASL